MAHCSVQLNGTLSTPIEDDKTSRLIRSNKYKIDRSKHCYFIWDGPNLKNSLKFMFNLQKIKIKQNNKSNMTKLRCTPCSMRQLPQRNSTKISALRHASWPPFIPHSHCNRVRVCQKHLYVILVVAIKVTNFHLMFQV